MTHANPRDSHDREAARYDRYVAEHGCYGHEAVFGLMVEFVKAGETVLDMGIGTGLSSILFHRVGLRVSGFDGSRNMLDVCAAKGFAAELVRHDLEDVPYPYAAGSFNHVLCVSVLHFFANLAPVFREAARVVRPGGCFAFTVEEQQAEQPSEYVIRPDDGVTYQMFRHSDAYVAECLASTGFTLLKRFEFFADRHSTDGHKIYHRAHVARRVGG